MPNLETIALISVIGLPLITALVLSLFHRRLVRAAGWLAGGATALSLSATLALIPALRQGVEPALQVGWIPTAGVTLQLHLDWLTLPFLITEGGVTLAAIVYAWGYHHRDAQTPYFYALLLLFAVGMSGTTLADVLVLFYTFWELMLVASTVLILVWGEEIADGPSRRQVALKYFIFTHVGSLMVLVGLLVLYNAVGQDSFSALRAGFDLAPPLVTTIVTLFILGFCVKMAIFPLHLWLPDAHTVAPMPVTIMLAAAMLSMGAYGILRFPLSLFGRAQLQPFAVPLMIGGIVSEIYGALMALAEEDVKRIVAYSSVSQMGYILFGLGTLTRDGVTGATLHVVFHAIVKALLFMVLGIVIHATGRRRIDEFGGLGRRMPVTAACAAVGALALAGVPPLCLFDSEWMIFAGGFHTAHLVLSIATLFGSLLTVIYILRLGGRLFLGDAPEGLRVERPSPALLVPTAIVAALAVIEGLFPAPLFDWVTRELDLLLRGQW